MTRDEAIALVRDSLVRLPSGRMGAASRAFHHLLEDPNASDDILKHAHTELVAALPNLKEAVDRILADRIILPKRGKKEE